MGKTIINNPPNHHVYGYKLHYKPFPVMGGLWLWLVDLRLGSRLQGPPWRFGLHGSRSAELLGNIWGSENGIKWLQSLQSLQYSVSIILISPSLRQLINFNVDHDDLPMDSGVAYFQTNPSRSEGFLLEDSMCFSSLRIFFWVCVGIFSWLSPQQFRAAAFCPLRIPSCRSDPPHYR